jgi:GTP-binding protein
LLPPEIFVPLQKRSDLRNVAIVAHVDHGKTTLVDKMLWQSGAFRSNQDVNERVMDSMDLEREKGITILAKNTAVKYGTGEGAVIINIVDTPGHADFGGEVERALSMVDGVLLLVDASEGPLPQTRFVLRKTLEAKLPVILVINKVDRPDARIAEVVHDVEELFLDLDADIDQLGFPIVYCVSREGKASMDRPADGGGLPDGATLVPLLDLLIERIPAPDYDTDMPLQALVTNLDASPYVGRLALCRVRSGTLHKGRPVAWCRADGTIERARVAELYTTDALERVPTDSAGPGEIVAVAGIPEITIGETLADPDDPRPLPVIHIDDPSLSMTIGINTSILAGQDGSRMTARLVQNRLESELVGNVSIRVLPTERPDTWEVQGRGELQLAVLVEMMRREGFELTVGKPQVLTKEVDGVVHEPVDRLTVDVPEEFMGVITQLLALRKGRMEQIVNHGTGWVRVDYLVPARGLIGFRTELLTETRGTALLHHVFECFEPWAGTIRARTRGSLVADRHGPTTAYSLLSLQDRGQLFVAPAVVVYEGMIVGENARADDMDVNPTKEKKLTNMRSSSSDNFEKLIPPRPMSLEQALEFIAEDECVEVTPHAVRLRKVVLDQTERGRAAKRAKALV